MAPYLSFYDILGISRSASGDEIRKAYRKKALETHPDKLSPTATKAARQAAATRFHLIHNAFETLGDPHRRKAYDAWGSKVDPTISSEESAKRMADRNEWASNLKEGYERRKVSRSYTAPPSSTFTSRPSSSSYSSSSQPRPTPKPRPASSSSIPPPVPTPPITREPPEPLSYNEEQLIAEILEEVRSHMPAGFEERKKRALEKKAERERAELPRRTMPV